LDWDEIWQECSSLIYASIHGVIFNLMSHFQDGGHDVISQVLPPGDRCCHLVSQHEAFSWQLCSSISSSYLYLSK